MRFRDRRDAGARLAEALSGLDLDRPVVVALPRGGVPVAFEVARALGAPLEVLVVRKVGAPGNPEVGLGALVDGTPPQVVLSPQVVEALAPPPGWIEEETARQREELARRRRAYAGDRPAPDVRGRTVVLVDDGIATGGTVRAALAGLAQAGASRVVLAVPVAPAALLPRLRDEADEVICLEAPQGFRAVGLHYDDFDQTGDAEVIDLLARAREGRP